jgi:WD40-like Beta Propeller Repeat
VAATKAGALVVLNAATGTVQQTLVQAGVVGDEISVSATGTVYFTSKHGCTNEIESVPLTGGSAVAVAAGSLPAISPDGTKLAYVVQPGLTLGCFPSGAGRNLTGLSKLVVRTLSTGAQVTYHAVPPHEYTGLPEQISHLSWAADNQRLAVSIAAPEDNEGWDLVVMDTGVAHYYLTGAGTTSVLPTGAPTPQRSYLREGVFLPDGNLFISRACCGGVPVHNISRLMWEVNTAGVLVHQVAIGYPTLDHDSLDASPTGQWLLYLAGGTLYVSDNGARPTELTSGLTAAAWS